MTIVRSVVPSSGPRLRRGRGWVLTAAGLLIAAAGAACSPVSPLVLTEAILSLNAGIVSVTDIVDAIGETDSSGDLVMTEDERRDALRTLGITDDELVNYLAREDVVFQLIAIAP